MQHSALLKYANWTNHNLKKNNNPVEQKYAAWCTDQLTFNYILIQINLSKWKCHYKHTNYAHNTRKATHNVCFHKGMYLNSEKTYIFK